MTDRELILVEIERLIQNNADTHPMPHPELAGDEMDREGLAIWQILGHIKDFISALPAEPEPMVRNCIFINCEPSEVYPLKNILTLNGLAMYGRFASDKIESKQIEIREVQNALGKDNG